MLRKIIFTFSSRLFVTAINFLVILITARYLGAEGRGMISLLMLGITINLLVSNVFGGAAISFLAPRVELFRLVAPAYSWAICSTLMVTGVLMLIDLMPVTYTLHLFLLSLLQAFYNIHLNLLIGKAHIRAHNIVNALQVAILFTGLAALIFIFKNTTVQSYLFALYTSLGLSFMLSLFFLKDEVRLFPVKEWWKLWKTILKNGYIIQIASIAQLLNYRMSYYVMDHFSISPPEGKKLVGVYSTAIALAEAIWLIGRSMGLIQYTHIVKGNDNEETRTLTRRFGKISFMLTFLVLIPVIMLSAVFYRFVFGDEFGAMKQVLILLSPGIACFGMALMYSNYFAGLGMNKVNLYGSLWGLLVTVGVGLVLIPAWGMTGAAITASLSYLVTSLFLWYAFITHTGIMWKDLLPEKKDLLYVKTEFINFLRSSAKKG